MAAPSYELIFFDFAGFGGHTRLAFHHAGVDFKDTFVDYTSMRARIAAEPDHFPFKQVPVLLLDGGARVIADSHAILRYVCQTHGMYPTDAFEAAQAESVVEYMRDQWSNLERIYTNRTLSKEEKDAEYAKHYAELPGKLALVEARLGDKPFFGGDAPSYADFFFFSDLWTRRVMGGDAAAKALDSCEKLVALETGMAALPTLSEHIADMKARAAGQKAAVEAATKELEAELAAKEAAEKAGAAADGGD